eukprot:3521337-Pleurochrysis_carterae.AAC.3
MRNSEERGEGTGAGRRQAAREKGKQVNKHRAHKRLAKAREAGQSGAKSPPREESGKLGEKFEVSERGKEGEETAARLD